MYFLGINVPISETIQQDLTLSEALAILSTITYNNTSDEPGSCSTAQSSSLVITIVVNDNVFDSNYASIFIEIICINDIPLLDLDVTTPGDKSVLFLEGSVRIALYELPKISLIDPDSELFYNATIKLINSFDGSDEFLLFYSNETLNYTVSGNATSEISFKSTTGINAEQVNILLILFVHNVIFCDLIME